MAKVNKRRYQTPIEIRDDNQTPLELDLLESYMEAVEEGYFHLSELRAGEKNKTLLVQAGTHAIPVVPKQANELDIISMQKPAAQEMLKIARATMRIAKKTRLKILDTGKRRLIDRISLKQPRAIKQKAIDDYGGDLSRVVDPVRFTLEADNVDQLQLLSEIFRPCARGVLGPDVDFEVIRYRNEFNLVNPDRGGIRRLHVNVRLPRLGGYVGEIFGFYGPSSAKYDISREAYGVEKPSAAAVERAVLRGQGFETTKKAQTRAVRAGHRRKKANDEAADFPEVRALVMNQRAYLVNEFPVIINEDGREGRKFALVPNPASGLWETDQKFLDVIRHPEDYPDLVVVESNTFEARLRGEALCRHEELSESMRAEIT